MKILSLFCFLLLPLLSYADMEVALGEVESTPGKSLIKLTAKNTFDQDVRDARVWVFLMDGAGNVVGNKAAWIVGGGTGASDEKLPKTRSPLEPNEEREFLIVVSHDGPASNGAGKVETTTLSPKITFTRIILADGTSIDPRKDVKASATDGE